MRLLPALLAVALLTGCASTNVIDVTWDEDTLAELNARSNERSVWHTLEEAYTLRKFIASTDSVMFRVDFGVGETPFPQGGRFVRRDGSAYWWQVLSANDIDHVSFGRRNQRRGFSKGALVGAAFVGVPAISFVRASYDSCTPGPYADWGDPWDCRQELVQIAVGAVVVGTLLGGLIGAAIGTKETILYRFKGGSVSATPGGASVKIDVGR